MTVGSLIALFIGLPLSILAFIGAAWLAAEPKGSASREHREYLRTMARREGMWE